MENPTRLNLESNLPTRKIFQGSILILIFVGFCGFARASFAEEQFKYDSRGRRDPFTPLVTKEGRVIIPSVEEYADIPLENMKLEGILWDPQGESSAILNGKIVRVGTVIGDYEIKEILHSHIIVVKGDETVLLRLRSYHKDTSQDTSIK